MKSRGQSWKEGESFYVRSPKGLDDIEELDKRSCVWKDRSHKKPGRKQLLRKKCTVNGSKISAGMGKYHPGQRGMRTV